MAHKKTYSKSQGGGSPTKVTMVSITAQTIIDNGTDIAPAGPIPSPIKTLPMGLYGKIGEAFAADVAAGDKYVLETITNGIIATHDLSGDSNGGTRASGDTITLSEVIEIIYEIAYIAAVRGMMVPATIMYALDINEDVFNAVKGYLKSRQEG